MIGEVLKRVAPTEMLKYCRPSYRRGRLPLLILVAMITLWAMVRNELRVYDNNQQFRKQSIVLAKSVPIHMVITAVNNRTTVDVIELCSVYSVASLHPNRSVIVHVRKELPEMHLWSKLSNVIIRIINDSTVCANTPVEKFYEQFVREVMPVSAYGAVEQSDIIRVCIVYKYGGTYMDTDVIQLASFNDSIEEFVLTQQGHITNSLFHFTKNGSQYLADILATIEKSFQFNKWAIIGPGVFTKTFNKVTTILKISDDTITPIKYQDANEAYLNPKNVNLTKAIIETKKSIGVHIYRSQLFIGNIEYYSLDSYLARIIEDRCKPIYQHKVVCAKTNGAPGEDCYLPFEGKQTA